MGEIFEIKLYRNPMGKAFKSLFDFIKENFYDKDFCVEDLPDVNEDYVKQVDEEMDKSGIFWMGPGADKQAKINIMVKMSGVGLLNYRRVIEHVKDEHGIPVNDIEKVLYNLTGEGKQAKVVFGD